ncbi:hypothetical protein QL285_052886 [Trifolium repens]|jgi:hypothetical protein|nr:hypothetical protein QL285_052886 [Trifolium repens]
MDKGDLYSSYFELLFTLNNNVSIKTTTVVDYRYDVIDDHISRFLTPTSDSKNKTKVFGFDTEWNIVLDRDSSSYANVQGRSQIEFRVCIHNIYT